jgi:hypothetical protein
MKFGYQFYKKCRENQITDVSLKGTNKFLPAVPTCTVPFGIDSVILFRFASPSQFEQGKPP